MILERGHLLGRLRAEDIELASQTQEISYRFWWILIWSHLRIPKIRPKKTIIESSFCRNALLEIGFKPYRPANRVPI